MVDPDVLRWVKTWQEAGPELEAVRREEVRLADNAKSLESLAGLFNHATRTRSPRTTSGMVEMQRIFAKLRPRD